MYMTKKKYKIFKENLHVFTIEELKEIKYNVEVFLEKSKLLTILGVMISFATSTFGTYISKTVTDPNDAKLLFLFIFGFYGLLIAVSFNFYINKFTLAVKILKKVDRQIEKVREAINDKNSQIQKEQALERELRLQRKYLKR